MTLKTICAFPIGFFQFLADCQLLFLTMILEVFSSYLILAFHGDLLKFEFFEKATKFEKIFAILLTRVSCSVHATAYLSKSRRRFFKTDVIQNFNIRKTNWFSFCNFKLEIIHQTRNIKGDKICIKLNIQSVNIIVFFIARLKRLSTEYWRNINWFDLTFPSLVIYISMYLSCQGIMSTFMIHNNTKSWVKKYSKYL